MADADELAPPLDATLSFHDLPSAVVLNFLDQIPAAHRQDHDDHHDPDLDDDSDSNFDPSISQKPKNSLKACLINPMRQHGEHYSVLVRNMSLKPKDPSMYIFLLNTCAVAGDWPNVANIHRLMVDNEIKKEPGYSWIELGKDSCMFVDGETSHDMRIQIVSLLEELMIEMKKRGYVLETNSVMHDLDEHEKEQQLMMHSERLAVAFGLLRGVPGTKIRVVKNLRVCDDCHTVLKMISSITSREIVVRDATRFHHFSYGSCSCGDFW